MLNRYPTVTYRDGLAAARRLLNGLLKDAPPGPYRLALEDFGMHLDVFDDTRAAAEANAHRVHLAPIDDAALEAEIQRFGQRITTPGSGGEGSGLGVTGDTDK